MTMVGDMFDHALKARVSGLCAELLSLLNSQELTSTFLYLAAQILV
jgi:hypothetical protein